MQQNLIADHECGDGFRILPGEAYARGYLRRALPSVPIEPNSLNDFQPHLGRKFGDLIETKISRIGTDTFGYFGKLGEIFRDLVPRHRCRQLRRLVVAEGRVGYALQLGIRIDRRARQVDRYGQPPPHRGDRTQGYDEKRQRRAGRNS